MTEENLARTNFFWRHAEEFGRYAGLIAIIAFFSYRAPDSFPTKSNILTVATQTVIVAIAAMGATMIIISGGIDLSVGSVIALSTVVTALGILDRDSGGLGLPPMAAALLGIASGGLCGLANGLIITGLRIVPFIATLGMMSIARGSAKLLAGGETVRPDFSWLDDLMSKFPPKDWMILPAGVWLMIAVALVAAIILRKTVFGRRVFAIGSNEATARLCGLNVPRIKVIIYVIAGLLAGLAGLMQYSRLTLGDPTVAIGLELDVIAAVVIGGGSLSGGEGSVSGTLIGAFILQFLRNGCNQIGVDNFVQDMMIGAIIIIAVSIDQLRKRLNA